MHANERTIKFTNQPLEKHITLPKASMKGRNFLRAIHAIIVYYTERLLPTTILENLGFYVLLVFICGEFYHSLHVNLNNIRQQKRNTFII